MNSTGWAKSGGARSRVFRVALGVIAGLLLAGGITPPALPAMPAAPAALAAPAAQINGYELVTNNIDVNLAPNEVFTSTINCLGKIAIGGGAIFTAPSPPPNVALMSDGPLVPAGSDTWRVDYANLGTTTARVAARLQAICVGFASGTDIEQVVGRGFGPLPPGSQVGASAGCPSGKKVIGGGVEWRTVRDTPVQIVTNSRHGNGWTATYVNTSTRSVDSLFNVVAYCATSSVNIEVVSPQTIVEELAPGETRVKTLDCNGNALMGSFNLWDVSPSTQAPRFALIDDGAASSRPVNQVTTWRWTYQNFGTTPLRIQYFPALFCTA